jgi:hypothetical protein
MMISSVVLSIVPFPLGFDSALQAKTSTRELPPARKRARCEVECYCPRCRVIRLRPISWIPRISLGLTLAQLSARLRWSIAVSEAVAKGGCARQANGAQGVAVAEVSRRYTDLGPKADNLGLVRAL